MSQKQLCSVINNRFIGLVLLYMYDGEEKSSLVEEGHAVNFVSLAYEERCSKRDYVCSASMTLTST